jgi:hypothetical protein
MERTHWAGVHGGSHVTRYMTLTLFGFTRRVSLAHRKQAKSSVSRMVPILLGAAHIECSSKCPDTFKPLHEICAITCQNTIARLLQQHRLCVE